MDSRNDHASEYSDEEQELAAYLEDLISGVLARRAMEMFSKPRDPLTPHRFAQEASSDVLPAVEAPDETEAQSDSPDAETPVFRPPPKSGRSSMRSELMDLFRRTERTSVRTGGGPLKEVPRTAEAPAAGSPEASGFLQHYLEQLSVPPDLWSTGIAELDTMLTGGLGHGLHLVAGPAGVGKTAFLECMLWDATSSKHPVVYYPLKDGSLTVWMRLISTLGAILGGRRVSLTELRSRALRPESLELLHSLDDRLQQSVLPLLSLIDAVPAHADVLGAFIRDVSSRAGVVKTRLGRTPLVLLDDLDRLLRFAADPPPYAAISRLDEALVANHVTIVASVGGRRICGLALANVPVQTVLELKPMPGGDGTLRSLVVSVRSNMRTGGTGDLVVVLDDSSGLFAC
jgi:hypothetical protein